MTKQSLDHLVWRQPQGENFRFLPRHGTPASVYEWATQKFVKCMAFFPIYLIIVFLLTVITWVWVVPFVGDYT